MPTGVQLRDMVSELRAEVGHSQNVAQGANMLETLKHYLRRTQRTLWHQHNWLSLSLHATILTVANQRYYVYPAELDYKRIETVDIRWGAIWTPITKGISTAEYTVFDSQVGVVSDPVQRWDHTEYEILPEGQSGNPNGVGGGPYTIRHMIELWPIPASEYQIRMKGRMELLPFVADDDVCTIDSDLIILFAAAQILARQKAEDAGLIKAEGVALLNKLKALENKTPIVSLNGRDDSLPYGRPGIDFMP